MLFYPSKHPEVHEVTMCTVVSFDDSTGFYVQLDEYDNQKALLPLKELSNKKIRKSITSFLKIGTQLPLCVIEVDDDGIVVSKKGLRASAISSCKERYSLNVKLFALGRRIAFAVLNAAVDGKVEEEDIDVKEIGRLEGDWVGCLQAVNSPAVELPDHPFTMISDRSRLSTVPIPADKISVLEDHFVTLFGIHPITETHNVTIQTFSIEGMDEVKRVLTGITKQYDKVHTDEELYSDPHAANVTILPTAIPVFQVNVTAYQREQVERTYQQVQDTLKAAGFNLLRFA